MGVRFLQAHREAFFTGAAAALTQVDADVHIGSGCLQNSHRNSSVSSNIKLSVSGGEWFIS
jgi:hypothetical protein